MEPIDRDDLCNLIGCATVVFLIAFVLLGGASLFAVPWIIHHVRIV